jgi:hypothetical protein
MAHWAAQWATTIDENRASASVGQSWAQPSLYRDHARRPLGLDMPGFAGLLDRRGRLFSEQMIPDPYQQVKEKEDAPVNV